LHAASYHCGLIAGTLFLSFGALLSTLIPVTPVIAVSFLVAGFISIVFTLIHAFRHGPHIHDEYSRRVGLYSLSYSWLATFFLIILLVWVNHFHLYPLSTAQVLAFTLVFMSVSSVLIKVYFSRRGIQE
jgi:hypothetical protein